MLKRGHVLAELLETERIYVAEMGSILKVSRFSWLLRHVECLHDKSPLYMAHLRIDTKHHAHGATGAAYHGRTVTAVRARVVYS